MIGTAKTELLKRVMAGEAEPANRAERRVIEQDKRTQERRARRARARVQRALAKYSTEEAAA